MILRATSRSSFISSVSLGVLGLGVYRHSVELALVAIYLLIVAVGNCEIVQKSRPRNTKSEEK